MKLAEICTVVKKTIRTHVLDGICNWVACEWESVWESIWVCEYVCVGVGVREKESWSKGEKGT